MHAVEAGVEWSCEAVDAREESAVSTDELLREVGVDEAAEEDVAAPECTNWRWESRYNFYHSGDRHGERNDAALNMMSLGR